MPTEFEQAIKKIEEDKVAASKKAREKAKNA